jgi:hypothetical protein
VGLVAPLQQHALSGPGRLQNSWAPDLHMAHDGMIRSLAAVILNRSEWDSIPDR